MKYQSYHKSTKFTYSNKKYASATTLLLITDTLENTLEIVKLEQEYRFFDMTLLFYPPQLISTTIIYYIIYNV